MGEKQHTKVKSKEDKDKGREFIKVENRDIILAKALNLFYSKGYDAVGVQEIADASGISKPTLYHYFKSKNGLLESLLKEKCMELNKQLRIAAEYEGDLMLTLSRITRVYLSIGAKSKEFYFLMSALFYSARENAAYIAIKPYMTEQFQIIRSVFEKAGRELGNMRGRQEQFAMGLQGIINQNIIVFYEKEEKDNRLVTDELVYSLVHQFMHGIYS